MNLPSAMNQPDVILECAKRKIGDSLKAYDVSPMFGLENETPCTPFCGFPHEPRVLHEFHFLPVIRDEMFVVSVGGHSGGPQVFSLRIHQMKCDSDVPVLFDDGDGLSSVAARNAKSEHWVGFGELRSGTIPNEAQILEEFDTLGNLTLQPLQLEIHDLPRLCPREQKASRRAGTAQLIARE